MSFCCSCPYFPYSVAQATEKNASGRFAAENSRYKYGQSPSPLEKAGEAVPMPPGKSTGFLFSLQKML